ncbi:exocyst complex component 4 isoform X1 [Lampetra fluviatilis]
MASDVRYRSAVSKSKDPSGLLISVIRTLSTSDDVHDREAEKQRLEEAYDRCDHELDDKIVQHYTELTTAIRTYNSITERIAASRSRIRQVRENLLSCKTLLQCKRHELRKLWVEGVEHKHVLALLDEIEDIRQVPQRLDRAMGSKHYLRATDMLVSAVEALDGHLRQVEGLSELRLELHARKMTLHVVLIDELHRHLYIRSTGHAAHHAPPPHLTGSLGKETGTPHQHTDVTSPPAPRKAPDSASSHGKEVSVEMVTENPEERDPEEDSARFMAVLVAALAKLGKIPDAIKAIKERFERELQAIVRRSTTQVADSAYQRGESAAPRDAQPGLLLELMELLFDKFRCVADAHSVVLAHLKQAVGPGGAGRAGDVKLYDMADVWAKIQAVLQMLLTDYLDVKNTRAAGAEPSAQLPYPSSGGDFSSFFVKKKQQRQRPSLFKFESSSHAISMSTYLREQRQALYIKSGALQGGADDNLIEGGGVQFVCKPGARNITVIFHPLMRFIKETEQAMGYGPGKQCTLREFLTQYVKNIFLNQVHLEINKEIEAVTKVADPLKTLANADTMKALAVQRPLLQGAVVVEKSVQDLMNLVHDLSAYSDQFLHMICIKLQEYRAMCHAAYRNIVAVHSEDRLVISASWAKDDDITRLLKSLPNWTNLAQAKQPRARGQQGDTNEEEYTRAINAKESDVLTGNLGEQLIPEQAILRDPGDLKALANLHESLEWLASRLNGFLADIPAAPVQDTMSPAGSESSPDKDLLSVPEQILNTLWGLTREFQDMADRCLLVLHLEVRVHCFYYLIPLAKQGNYAIVANVESMDYDPLVVRLNKDICAVEEMMNASLQLHKFQYIFEGLGHLISSILINGAQHFKRISESGIKKMCRNIFVLQQNLTNITMSREADLDFARQYYEMMYTTPDELLSVLVDQGVRYSELDYINALALLQRSQAGVGDQTVQNGRMQRLKEIIREQNAIKQAAKDKKITTV